MPQTREHLEICSLLGVRRGLIALAKSDLVDEEWRAMITGEIAAVVEGTFLAGAPIVPVSTKTGAGLDDVRSTIAAIVDAIPPREAGGVFRLPVDRVFTLKGFGTIVTGTVLGGEVAVGDELVVIPSGLAARVRGIEVHGAPMTRAVAGLRVAINLGGVAVDDLARGDLLSHPGRVAGSHILDVELTLVKGQLAPTKPMKVLFHHGGSQTLATLALLPGDPGLAQIRLSADVPVGALPGDRFILRGFAKAADHGTTIGGGRIVRVLAPRAKAGAQHAAVVAALAGARRDQRIALDVRTAAAAGIALPDLVRRLGVPMDALAEPLETLVAAGELLATGTGDATHYLHAQAVAELERTIVERASVEGGIAREELRTQLPAALPARSFDAILGGLSRRGALVAEADRVRRSASPLRPALAPADAALAERLAGYALQPPRPQDLPALVGLAEPAVKAALDRIVAAKLAIRVKPDLIVHADALAALQTRLLAFLATHATIDAQQWKELTGASRKYTIPLAEYFDAQKVTLRVGDLRRKR